MKRLILFSVIVFNVLIVTRLTAQDYALDFNGSSQYVDCGAGDLAITDANPRTIEAWINCNTFANTGAFQMGTPGVSHGEFTLRTGSSDNQWVVQIWNNDISFSVSGSKNTWTHFALTYDGTDIKVYVNGDLVTTQSRALTTDSANFYIGRWSNNYFDGQIDEVLVYNDVRTQTEIQDDMFDVYIYDSNLLAYYKMSDGSGSSLSNDAFYHTFDNIGTLVNGPTWVTGVYETPPAGAGTSGDPYQIASLLNLYWLSQHSGEWDKSYRQTADIDASATAAWGSGTLAGFSCIGNYSASFTGTYNGDGHSINNLYVIRTYTYDLLSQYVGMFGNINNATISNLGLTNVYIEGYRYVGGMVGQAQSSTITNCYSTGTVKSRGYNAYQCGGLVGRAVSSSISSCYSSSGVTGKGEENGGLIGYMSSTTLTESYSTGNVTSSYYDDNTGGLIGRSENSSTVSECFSLGNVSASSNVFAGGLIGWNLATVSDCFSRGSVSSSLAGGLVGNNYGTINNSYATGAVSDQYYNGGLVSSNSGTVTHSFWDTETSGQSSSSGGTGKTTADMQVRPTFTAATWDFKGETTNGTDEIWNIGNSRNDGYPYFDWQYPSDPVIDPATVSTTAISDISTTSASSGGEVTNNSNGAAVTVRGVCWSTSQNPVVSDSHTTDGSGAGSFTSSLTGLSSGTTYYVRAYATNPAGTSYGAQETFTTWTASPVFSASPTSHDFGTLLIGETSQQTITVSNTGGGYLYITAVTAPDGEYTVSPASDTIAGGDNQAFTLTFTPVTDGAHNGNLSFTDNLGNHTVSITGSGVFQAQSDGGKMLTFNGTSQYLTADLATTAIDNVTLEAWVNWEGQTGISPGIIYHGHSGSSGYGLIVQADSTLGILCGGVAFATTSTTLPTGAWHHVAVVRDNGTWKLYLDGIEKSVSNSTTTPAQPTGNCTIGSVSSGTQPFKGKIDEVRLWTVARSQAQIRSGYGSLNGNETGLAAYWRLDEGSGSTTGDGSGHGKTATLVNSPTWGTSTAPVSTPIFSASPSSYDFGNVLIGESPDQTITVTNNGGGILHLSAVTTANSKFTVSPSEVNLSSGASQDFSVEFTPTAAETLSGDLSFTDNVGNHTVGVTGSGVFQAQSDGGKMLTLNGTDQYLTTDLATTAIDNITLEAWVYWDGPNGGNPGIIYHGNSGSSGYGIILNAGASPAYSLSILCGGVAYVYSATPLPTGAWHHVAAVRDNGTWKLYLDGVERAVTNSTATPNTPSGSCTVGSASDSGSRFKGKIDEVRIWTVARSQAQIQASYGSLNGNETGLAAYWRLDEGSGSTSGDGSGHGITATLMNSPSWGTSTAPVSSPAYQTSASSLAFGDVTVDSTADQTVTITNNGGGILNVSSVTSDNARFTISPSEVNLAAGANQIFTVTFAPTAEGVQTGTLTLTHNPNGTTHTVSLSGTGQPAGDNSLPVELVAFRAVQDLKAVKLYWKTESEIENLGFRIERKQISEKPILIELTSYKTTSTLRGQGNCTHSTEYTFTDDRIDPEVQYVYYLYDVNYQGLSTCQDSATVIVNAQEWNRIPEEFSLGNSYPNPFNPRISIPLGLPEAAEGKIAIYDITGREVKILFRGKFPAGRLNLIWDGADTRGKSVGAGIYFLTCNLTSLTSDRMYRFNQKIVMVK